MVRGYRAGNCRSVMSGAIHTIHTPGAAIVAETEGSGEPLVLLHGFAADRRSWDQMTSVLSRERRIVRYDLRGYGESAESGRVRFRHSQDLLAVLDMLEIAQCDLLGVSMGGSVAVNFTLDFPARVRRLILISPGLVGWERSDPWRSLWTRITEAARSQDISQARELWWNHPLFSTTRSRHEPSEILHGGISRYSGKHWLYDDEEPALPDLDRLPMLCVPTLLITGTRDLADFRLIADLIEAATPDLRRVDLEGAGHLPQLEYPLEVMRQVSTFLG
jgi:pimeloyl-ACP methyl ester carboxylesterase